MNSRVCKGKLYRDHPFVENFHQLQEHSDNYQETIEVPDTVTHT